MILSFCYTAGKTLKARQYTKPSANVTNAMPIGVLGMWYSWDKSGKLTTKSSKHTFIEIEKYKGTIPKPSYSRKILKVNESILQQLNDLTLTLR